jgi:hypothetical protein
MEAAMTLLEQTLAQEVADIEEKLGIGGLNPRTLEYFQVVRHNLAQAEFHMKAGKRALNNLRRLENIG